MKNRKKIIIAVTLGILFLGLAISGVLLIKNAGEAKTYRVHMEKGQKYLGEMKYEDAVASFEFALEKNPKSENAYIGIFRARDAQGEYLQATEILRKGYKNTKSKRIDLLLANYLEKHPSDEGEDVSEGVATEKLAAGSDEITMNTAFVQKLTNFTYQDYLREFGNCVLHEMQGKTLEMKHEKLSGTFTYGNVEDEEASVDTSSHFPYKTARPIFLRLDNVGLLFRDFESGITAKRLMEIIGGQVKCTQDEENDRYVVSFQYNQCQFKIESDRDGNIVKSSAWNEITPPRPEEGGQTAVYQGVIVDAITGCGLEGAKVSFRSEDAGMEGTQTVTDREGAYQSELQEGSYDVVVSKEGYIQDHFELEIKAEERQSGDSFPLSPELVQGEVRIVLTWRVLPTDLDSHLEGVTSDHQDVYVYFRRRSNEYGGNTLAKLDVDDMDGYGPETTTIYAGGSYLFRVNDYTGSGTLASSGAEVKVYLPGQTQPVVFEVPQGTGNWWDVCQIENGTVTPVNTLGEE